MAENRADLAPGIQRFLSHLENERRASRHTVKAYLVDLAQYAAYLAEIQVALVPSSSAAVRGFLSRAAGRAQGASLALDCTPSVGGISGEVEDRVDAALL